MADISVVAKNRSSFNGIDITPDTTESTGLKINTWTPTDTSVASYGLYISQLSGANSRSLYLGNSIDIKSANGTGKITLGTGSVVNNVVLSVNLPPAGGTLITEEQLAAASGGGGGTATNYLPLANAWTNRNTFSRSPSGASTLTTATTLATTYALNMEISTSSDVTLGISSGGSHYLSTVQVKPQSLVVNASNTAAEVSALHITGAPTKTGPGAATSAYGLKISSTSTGGTGFDSAYGAYITQPSGATNNYALGVVADNAGTNIMRVYGKGTTQTTEIGMEIGAASIPTTLSFLSPTVNFSFAASSTANIFTDANSKTINIGTGATGTYSTTIEIGSATSAYGYTRIYGGTEITISPVATTFDSVAKIAAQATAATKIKNIEIGTSGNAGSISNLQFGSQTPGSISNFSFGTSSLSRQMPNLTGSYFPNGVFSFATSTFNNPSFPAIAVAGSSQYSLYTLAGASNHPWKSTYASPSVQDIRNTLVTNWSGPDYNYGITLIENVNGGAYITGNQISSIHVYPNNACAIAITVVANASSKGAWWEPISWNEVSGTDRTVSKTDTSAESAYPFIKQNSSVQYTTSGPAGVMWLHGTKELSTKIIKAALAEAHVVLTGRATVSPAIAMRSKAMTGAFLTLAKTVSSSTGRSITLSDSTNLSTGMFATHANIPVGTTIFAINVNVITLSADPSGTVTGPISFSSDIRYSKENTVAAAMSSVYFGAGNLIVENSIFRIPMYDGYYNIRANDASDSTTLTGPLTPPTPGSSGQYTSNYDAYVKYHSGFSSTENENFGHASGQWILKGTATGGSYVNLQSGGGGGVYTSIVYPQFTLESFGGNMREGSSVSIQNVSGNSSMGGCVSIAVRNRQPQKVSAFVGTGTVSRANATAAYILTISTTIENTVRLEVPSLTALPTQTLWEVLQSSGGNYFTVTLSQILIKKLSSTETKKRFIAQITRTTTASNASVSDVHTLVLGTTGITLTFSMPALNWIVPGQILEVDTLPDGIVVNDFNSSVTSFTLDVADTTLWTTGSSTGATPVIITAYNVAAVKYTASAHVTEVK